MADNSLFGSDFLEKVVEWSNLSSHSGKLFYSLDKDCKDSVGYISVGENVIEYSKVKPELTKYFEVKKAHFEYLKTIIVLPVEPHSSPEQSKIQNSDSEIMRRKLERIQNRIEKGSFCHFLKDPLEKCFVLQNRAIEDICEQIARFPFRIGIKSGSDDETNIDISGLPLLQETVESLESVSFGPMPILGGQKGLTFKFRYFSQSRMKFRV